LQNLFALQNRLFEAISSDSPWTVRLGVDQGEFVFMTSTAYLQPEEKKH
jgi:hypothetical protein